MKKFSSSASLSKNNNCNSNSSSNNAKITSKLIANQITNDIIKPKAISAAEAKLKNTNKNYAKMSSSSESSKSGGYHKMYNRQEIADQSDYSMRLNQPSTSIDVLSCVSTNSSSDSSSTLNVCDYLPNGATTVASSTATTTTAATSTALPILANCRKKSVVNDYATADYVMHRPKSSQSQHNPYKSPADKKQHRKHYSAQGLRSQQHTGSGPIYAKKHQHTKKPTTHHHNHNHTHKQTAAQYTPHSLHMSSSPPSPPPLRLPTAKKDRHS